jgi:hypothetical protein
MLNPIPYTYLVGTEPKGIRLFLVTDALNLSSVGVRKLAVGTVLVRGVRAGVTIVFVSILGVGKRAKTPSKSSL